MECLAEWIFAILIPLAIGAAFWVAFWVGRWTGSSGDTRRDREIEEEESDYL